MMKTQNQTVLVYINIYPLATQNQHTKTEINQDLIKPLREYLRKYNKTTVSSWFTTPSLLFTKLKASGRITIHSNSIILTQPLKNKQIELEGENSNILQINSTQIIIQGGYGFYTIATILNPTIILPTGKLSFDGNLTFILRQPKISINGITEFKNFYMLHPPTIYTDGRKTTFEGNLTLHIYVSDEYTIALPYKLNSVITVKYEKPIMKIDEIAQLLPTIPWLIIIGFIFLGLTIYSAVHIRKTAQ